ncbi:response regulator [Dongia sedimenti]|uniref:Response regulator n=1 Tax=Dongia sedimenti TaxID=3064282 RepID=A0ABU0YU52_9PROT|nr:response regulator [Rhodospirillaceae bacterium R-7]
MSDTARVLVVDDEPQILRFLRASLGASGFEVIEAETGAAALKRAAADAPEIVVLDLGLPDMDGKDVIKSLREWSEIPIIVLSARAREAEKIEALDLGADDYVNKPFGIGELLARLRAALRHRLRQQGATPVVKAGDLKIDIARRKVTRGDADIHLTPKEFDLLRLLAQNAGKVVTHRQLLQAVWGPAHLEDTAYLRVFIGQVRRKIDADDGTASLIENAAGVGYRLRDDS